MAKVYRILLEGGQVVPPTTSTASGVGTVVFDDTAVTAAYTINVRGVDFGPVLGGTPQTADTADDVTGLHIHSEVRGTNGDRAFGVIGPMEDADDASVMTAPDGSTLVTGVWETTDTASQSISTFATTLDATAIGADAALYFDLHTLGIPTGELRGQLVAVADDGDNEVAGSDFADFLPGLAGDDLLIGQAGADTLDGGAGNDTLEGGTGADNLDGGAGTDILSYYASAAGVTVDLMAGTVSGGDAEGDTISGFEGAEGGFGDDMLIGDGGPNSLSGGLFGNDTFVGGLGDDTFDGGDALSDPDFVDTVDYSATTGGVVVDLMAGTASGAEIGNDTLIRIEDVIGGSGNDSLTGSADTNFFIGGAGNDTIDGGGGADAVDYRGTMGVSVDLGAGSASGAGIGVDTLVSIEDAIGGDGDDTVFGTAETNFLQLGDGDDVAYGFDGSDTLEGGNGNDALGGGAGADTISGMDGDDIIVGDAGADSLMGGNGNDYFDGGSDKDTIEGGAGTDTLHGADGDDILRGGGGDDFLWGALGNDVVEGGDGSDIVTGGMGADTMSGGVDLIFDRVIGEADGDADVFVLASPGAQAIGVYDSFEGFEGDVDKIDVRASGANGLAELAFSNYPGAGLKIIAPDGSAAFLAGYDLADVTSDWFMFA